QRTARATANVAGSASKSAITLNISFWDAAVISHLSHRAQEDQMIRKAYLMTLRPGNQKEYERRHNSIWPELEELLRDHGVWSYSIFLNRATDQLFAYAEIESEKRWQQIAQAEVCQHWWAQMTDL